MPTCNDNADMARLFLDLTAEQERIIHQAACEMLAAAIRRRPVRLADASLGGASTRPVKGVFVTLKRRGRLRACCGVFGAPTALAEALERAARRTATEDPRFPSLSTAELRYLDVEVSLLDGFRPLTATGEQRASEVTIGHHGLQLRRGNFHGLLLPGVALEHNLDAQAFLEQACAKANVHASAWKEDDTEVSTFEARAITAAFDPQIAERAAIQPSWMQPDVAILAEHARRNLLALLTGAFPRCYASEYIDGSVQGLVVSIHLPGDRSPLQRFRFSLRPGLPLQATLFGLMEEAAHALRAQELDREAGERLRVDVAVLWDAALHGTVEDPDLEGFEPASRALLALAGSSSACIFDPKRSAGELLAEAVQEAGVKHPQSATLVSLAAVAAPPPVRVVNVAQPQQGPPSRAPAVAGAFYPAEAHALAQMVNGLLTRSSHAPAPWPAVLVPHAGLTYSGRIAGAVFSQVAIPEVVIIIGPRHRPLGMEWAVAPHQTWSLPGVALASDPDLARTLAERIPDLQLDALAHQREHSIEVQLPLLARLAPHTRVVGIVVGAGDLERCQQFAAGLAAVIRECSRPPLLVISSDLNHYASDAETRRLDGLALAALEQRDPASLYDTVMRHKISMCGLLPAMIGLATLQQLGGAGKCQRVGYATTADTTGDPRRVVGYAGMLLG